MQSVRPSVRFIAYLLEETYKRNEGKPAWEEQPRWELIDKFEEELKEFIEALKTDNNYEIEWEGIDLIATIANIIANRHTYLSTLERGMDDRYKIRTKIWRLN